MTGLEAGLLTGGLTGLFALAGVVVTYLLGGRQQRALAQDERMWSRRAETYVVLLQYQGSGMVEGYIESASAQEWAVRDELTAKAKAFASDEVLDLWQKSALASLALQSYVDEELPELTAGSSGILAIEEAAKTDPEFRRLRQAGAQAGKQLAAQIRAELDASRDGRPRQRRQGRSQDSLPGILHEQPAGPATTRRAGINGKPTSGSPAGPAWMTARRPAFCQFKGPPSSAT